MDNKEAIFEEHKDFVYGFLRHDAFNKSYFARKLYDKPDELIQKFHSKLYNRKGTHFSEYEIYKLHQIIIEFIKDIS